MGGGADIIESVFNVLGGEISDNEAASTGGAFSTAFLATLNVNGMRADRNKAGESGGVTTIDTTATATTASQERRHVWGARYTKDIVRTLGSCRR